MIPLGEPVALPAHLFQQVGGIRQQLLFLGVKFLLGDGAHVQQLFQLDDFVQRRGGRRCRLGRRGGGVLAVGDHGEDRDDFGSAVLCVPVDETGLFGLGRHQRDLEAGGEAVAQVDGDGHFLADILLLFAQAAAHNGANPAEQRPAHHGGPEAALGDRHPVLQQLEVNQIRKVEQVRVFRAGHRAAPGLAFGVRKDPPADGVGPAHRLVAPGIFLPGVDVVGDLLEALAGPAVQRAAFALHLPRHLWHITPSGSFRAVMPAFSPQREQTVFPPNSPIVQPPVIGSTSMDHLPPSASGEVFSFSISPMKW